MNEQEISSSEKTCEAQIAAPCVVGDACQVGEVKPLAEDVQATEE